MATTKMSAEEKQWRAEEDARTLRRAAEIQNDTSRVKAAGAIIQKELEALQTVANSTVTKPKQTQKPAPKKNEKAQSNRPRRK